MMDYATYAASRRRPLNAAERAAAVREAHRWLRTRWVHRGAKLGAGVDCGNLLIEIFHGARLIPRIDLEQYSRDWMNHEDYSKFLEYVEKFARKKSAPAEPGDIILFRIGKCISHGAMVINWPQIVHAYAPARCVTLDTMESPLGHLAVGVWEILTPEGGM